MSQLMIYGFLGLTAFLIGIGQATIERKRIRREVAQMNARQTVWNRFEKTWSGKPNEEVYTWRKVLHYYEQLSATPAEIIEAAEDELEKSRKRMNHNFKRVVHSLAERKIDNRVTACQESSPTKTN